MSVSQIVVLYVIVELPTGKTADTPEDVSVYATSLVPFLKSTTDQVAEALGEIVGNDKETASLLSIKRLLLGQLMVNSAGTNFIEVSAQQSFSSITATHWPQPSIDVVNVLSVSYEDSFTVFLWRGRKIGR